MSKAFASQADLADKKVTFTKLSDNAYAYTAEGDPNSGVIIGDNACMVIDTTATPGRFVRLQATSLRATVRFISRCSAL